MPMSIRSAAASRAGGRPASIYRTVAPGSPGSGLYRSLRSRPRSLYSGSTVVESDDYDSDDYDSDDYDSDGSGSYGTKSYGTGSYGTGLYDTGSYGSGSSDVSREVTEDHSSINPHTSTHHQPHGRFEEISSHMQDLEDGIADTRREWDDRGIDPSDMLLRIANYRQKLAMVASPEACRNPFLKLSFDGVDGSLKELEAQANVRKTREREETEEVARNVTERRENEEREEFERRPYIMQETAAIKDKIRDEKVAREKEKNEEKKRRRIPKENERKEKKTKFAAAMIERKRLEKEEKDRKTEQRATEGWKAYQKRTGRENAARTRDDQWKATKKQEREAEEEAEYQARFAEEDRRYSTEKAHRTKAKAALGNRAEESRNRERKLSETYARKAASDQEKKLRKELNKLEGRKKQIEDDLGSRR
ncbi:hypothetical protein BOTCAL_0599g00020 [Botryotinia calthae]|uniref:Uncharacterized protein n=1 Tax=Botryotinia calthae TaxID=38488 RepID=A0A4Y8CLI2_9HELO|nr:hypothetical protein BOTCAL_0599g00020 [Botryotinia calthae]